MLIIRLVALLAFLFLPGYLAVSLLVPRGRRMSGAERIYLAAVLGCGIVALISEVLGLAGGFGFQALMPAWFVLCGILLYYARRRIAWIKAVGWKEWASLALLAAISLALFLPPNRVVFGWNDDGVYPDIAALMVENGEIHTQAEVVTEVSPENYDFVFASPTTQDARFEAYLYKQYFITSFADGEIVPQFYHLWPSFMAVCGLFLGLENMFYAITMMAILSVAGIFLVARRMAGGRWAWAAAILALLSPLTVYFSRYTTSEMMASSLFIAAVICMISYRENVEEGGRIEEALTASFLLTLTFFTRIDFCLILVPLLVVYFVGLLRGERRSADSWLIAGVAMGFILANLVGWLYSEPYFYEVLGVNVTSFRVLVATAAAAVIGIPVYILRGGLRRFFTWLGPRRKIWVTSIWIAMGLAFVFFYFIRPSFADGNIGFGVINRTQGLSYQSQTLVRWGWYFSFPGLLLIFAGYAWLLSSKKSYAWLPLTTTGLFVTFFYMWNMACNPLQINVMRRLMSVIFPLAVVAISYALRNIWHGSSGPVAGRAGKIVAALLLLYLALFSLTRMWPMPGLREGGNQLEVSEAVHEITAEGVVLMDFNAGDLFGPPLLSFFGQRNAWLQDNRSLMSESFPSLLADLGFPEQPVYLLWRPLLSGDVPDMGGSLSLEEAGVVTWRQRSLEISFTRRPSKGVSITEDFVIYRIVMAETDGGSPTSS